MEVMDAVITCVKMMTPIEPEDSRRFTLTIIPSLASKPDPDKATP